MARSFSKTGFQYGVTGLLPRGSTAPRMRPENIIKLQGGGVNVSLRQSEAPWQVIYGRAICGGIYSFVQQQIPEVGLALHLVFTIACHRIEVIEDYILDGQSVTFTQGPYHWGSARTGSGAWENIISAELAYGDDNQDAILSLVSASASAFPGKWTLAHKQSGRAHVWIKLNYDPEMFKSGLPKIQFVVKGAHVYDPRSDTTAYSNNAALCILDYLTNTRYGLGCDIDTQIDLPSFEDAADICDELVTLQGGGTEARYTCNGIFELNATPQNILDQLETTIAGKITRIGGKWYCYPGKWRAPVSFQLSESDFIGQIRVQTKQSTRDTFNKVTGTFRDPNNAWQLTDFPPVKNHYYLEQDNGRENALDVRFPMTTSSATAQRMAKIALEDTRQSITIEGTLNLKGFRLQPQDNVGISLSRFGWVNKYFRVQETSLIVDSDANDVPMFAVSFRAKETAAGIYDWNDGEETTQDLAPNTELSDPSQVGAPTDLELESGTDHLYVRGDGTIFSRIFVRWTAPDDPFVTTAGSYEIQYKQSAAATWLDASPVSGISAATYILDVQDGALYDVRVRARSGLGFYSDWVTVFGHMVLGKTEPPSNVSNFTASVQDFGILLSWDPVSDADLSHYEIRLGTSWDTGVFIAEAAGTSYQWAIQSAGTYDFMIRAVDSSGNLSVMFDAAQAVISGPGMVNASFSVQSDTCYLTWEAPTSAFAVSGYRISYGATYAGSTSVAFVQGTSYPVIVNWGGTRRFWIVAVDVAGNDGAPFQLDVLINVPSAVTALAVQVIDNNVNLYWDLPTTHTLSINHHRIYRGDVFASADFLGTVAGTFFSRFEVLSGNYRYWVVAVDSAGSYGAETSITAIVDEPPDYILLDDVTLDPDVATINTNVVTLEDGLQFAIPADEVTTWEDHFLDRSWDSPQDQIDAGYPYFLQPGVSTGQVRWEHDIGAVLGAATINLLYNFEPLAGDVTIEPTISYSEDGTSWTDVVGSQTIATNFRYVRATFDLTASSDQGIVIGDYVRLKVDVKQKEDGGFAYANSSDSGGTAVTFNVPFVDVRELQVTPAYQSGLSVTANWDFVDVPNPTGFSVYLFNSTNGARVSGDFSWRAKGAVALEV